MPSLAPCWAYRLGGDFVTLIESHASTPAAERKHYADYGRERQAQIAQDYYRDTTAGTPTAEYEPYIAELRKGEL